MDARQGPAAVHTATARACVVVTTRRDTVVEVAARQGGKRMEVGRKRTHMRPHSMRTYASVLSAYSYPNYYIRGAASSVLLSQKLWSVAPLVEAYHDSPHRVQGGRLFMNTAPS